MQFSKDEINEFLVSYSDVQSLNDLECYITLPGEWPVVRMKLPWKPYREIAEGRIPRDVEDVFDPDIEATLAGEASDNQAGQIVGRLFGDATEAETPADEQNAGNAGDTAGAENTAASAAGATAPVETASGSSAQSAPDEAGGRVTALPPPANPAVPAAPAPAPAAAPPPTQPAAENSLQQVDIVKHRDFDPDDRF
ncbi:hypothetical protein [Pantoea agglomerans]|uniref:hypothetical protein n=1 Tax=Enterobacter agglomerans TaxID=549 RepID=UPI0035DD8167